MITKAVPDLVATGRLDINKKILTEKVALVHTNSLLRTNVQCKQQSAS